MQKKLILKLATLSVVLCSLIQPLTLRAQEGSSNMVFSPYTMYGIGDFMPLGNASSFAMGGVGVALRHAMNFNYLNPASLSAIPQKSALFNFAAQGQNYYSKTAYSATSYNNFDFYNVGLAVPLAKGVGLGFSLNPVTAVGYQSQLIDSTSSIVQNIGRAVYTYSGEGGVSQVAANLGVNVTRDLSIGASFLYYFGSIDRFTSSQIIPLLNSNLQYNGIYTEESFEVSKIGFSIGIQYDIRISKKRGITIGATYQPGVDLNPDVTKLIVSRGGNTEDTIANTTSRERMMMPTKIAGGLYYYSDKLDIGVDFTTQDWKNAFAVPATDRLTLKRYNQINFGVAYTPDRYDIRRAMSRWTYKLGARYNTSYFVKNGAPLNDFAISFGADIPMNRRGFSKVSVGAELGRRGTTKLGGVLENYVKVSVGIAIFGEDLWFRQQKFN